jgi:hypothetical protein
MREEVPLVPDEAERAALMGTAAPGPPPVAVV